MNAADDPVKCSNTSTQQHNGDNKSCVSVSFLDYPRNTMTTMKFLSFLLFLLTTNNSLPTARAQDNSTAIWTEGCFGNGGSGEVIKIGQPMFLCLHVANNKDWSSGAKFLRVSFQPKADEYSRFHVPNCECSLLPLSWRIVPNHEWTTQRRVPFCLFLSLYLDSLR